MAPLLFLSLYLAASPCSTSFHKIRRSSDDDESSKAPIDAGIICICHQCHHMAILLPPLRSTSKSPLELQDTHHGSENEGKAMLAHLRWGLTFPRRSRSIQSIMIAVWVWYCEDIPSIMIWIAYNTGTKLPTDVLYTLSFTHITFFIRVEMNYMIGLSSVICYAAWGKVNKNRWSRINTFYNTLIQTRDPNHSCGSVELTIVINYDDAIK